MNPESVVNVTSLKFVVLLKLQCSISLVLTLQRLLTCCFSSALSREAKDALCKCKAWLTAPVKSLELLHNEHCQKAPYLRLFDPPEAIEDGLQSRAAKPPRCA